MPLRPFHEWLEKTLQPERPALPVRYREPVRVQVAVGPEVVHFEALVAAFLRIGRRGEGPAGWGAPLADDPIAFVLEALEEPVYVRRATGEVLYRNRAALEIPLPPAPQGQLAAVLETVRCGERVYRRRAVRYGRGAQAVYIEVLSPGDASR
ncbi:MAG: hypothetical protein D6776_03635 [Planctomycetota bacterium]|nr:MAG: hypothetical protein D6776_03635 [Planctomycetota bacterium]